MSAKIEYSNCRTLPIESYGYVDDAYEPVSRDWPHKGRNELLFSSYIDATQRIDPVCKLKVTFRDGTFVYVTKK